MKNWTWAVLFVVAAGLVVSGCSASSVTTPASPSPTNGAQTVRSLTTGTWASTAADPLPGTFTLNPNTCGNFKWSITSMTVVSAAGTFSADCAGGLSVAGNATASLDGSGGAAWGANGNVTGTGTSCSFVVTGTAVLETTGVRVNYNGTVCGTTITGSELLKKR